MINVKWILGTKYSSNALSIGFMPFHVLPLISIITQNSLLFDSSLGIEAKYVSNGFRSSTFSLSGRVLDGNKIIGPPLRSRPPE